MAKQFSALERIFLPRGIIRGGLLLLQAPVALELIEAAKKAQVLILGVDGFAIDESSTRPVSDIDLSRDPVPSDSWNAASRFIEQSQQDGLYFEIVIGREKLA